MCPGKLAFLPGRIFCEELWPPISMGGIFFNKKGRVETQPGLVKMPINGFTKIL